MAHHWLSLIAFFLQLIFSRPECMLCTEECQQLQISENAYVNISIVCSKNDANFSKFLEKGNFKNLQNVKIIHPLLSKLDLSNFSSAKIVNLSNNNLTFINVSGLNNVEILSLSHNRLVRVVGNVTKLKLADLSHNSIGDISKCQILSGNTYISLNNNFINNIKQFSSPTLEHLDLKNNQINVLELNSLPSLRILDLSNNSITKISLNISLSAPKLEILNLSSNAIKELSNYNFNLTNLLRLDLRKNNLTHLFPKCFTGLNKLQFLDISENNLNLVFPSTLQYLSGLIQLIISDNIKLSSQDFGLLLASKRLKSVNASKTNQIKIPSSLIRSVRYLFLSFNNITQIQCGDLDSYPLLNNLDLSHNNISYIEDDALGRLELLTTITLSYNSLTSVPYTLPNNLRILFLNDNKINKITTTDFSSITRLEKLDLSRNKITTVAEGSFSQLGNLQSISISGNNIQVLSSSIFTSQGNLKFLDLSFLTNVTKCDQVLCFPVPEPNELQELILEKSPVLVQRLMNDAAALKTFKQLNVLNMAFSNLSDVKNLPNYFPRLRSLSLQGNSLNCNLIHSIYFWLEIKETDECTFSMNEIVTTTQSTTQILNSTTEPSKFPTTTGFFVDFEPFKIITDYSVKEEITKNDIYYKESDLGVVDAYEGSTPTSHPGLFILLLLPIALVSTCLILNYSRSKRQMEIERQSEMDIEISNISSELW